MTNTGLLYQSQAEDYVINLLMCFYGKNNFKGKQKKKKMDELWNRFEYKRPRSQNDVATLSEVKGDFLWLLKSFSRPDF